MARKNKPGAGRPPIMTPDVLGKLEAAFVYAMSDEEACLYAGINPDTLYEYQKAHPKFTERKKALKLTPNLTARKAIVNALGDPQHAWRWMERKDPELRPITKLEHSGKIQTEDVTPKDPKVLEAIKQYEETRKKQILEESAKRQ